MKTPPKCRLCDKDMTRYQIVRGRDVITHVWLCERNGKYGLTDTGNRVYVYKRLLKLRGLRLEVANDRRTG